MQEVQTPNPGAPTEEALSIFEKEALANLRSQRKLRAQSLKAAGFDLARLGICACGENTEPRKKRCAECEAVHNKKILLNAKPV